ncbi:hypothetical protein F511_03690 [Dorcoceras hygrometricum]|uniref:CUE domain-containing protein n=1 Tax=Dorcoceras hygrometricum TaxID=472368 RepID=A0A2Z7BEF4_9LAMI|nr:hypothetical protein F511_03690 [Dorcoceras hygrometricum]
MGFNEVYNSLQELFPEIDSRVIRAVAIEHNKDPDAAVEAVLEEIIPFFSETLRPTKSLTASSSLDQSPKEFVATVQSVDGLPVNAIISAEETYANNGNGGHQSDYANDENDVAFHDTYNGQHDGEGELSISGKFGENSIKISGDMFPHGRQPAMLMEETRVNILQCEASVHPERTETVSAGKCPEDGIKTSSGATSSPTRLSCPDGNNSVGIIFSEAVPNFTMSHSESTVQVAVLPNMNGSNSETRFPSDTASGMEISSENVLIEDESTVNDSVSQSSQIHFMGVLDEVIAEAMNNKRTLFPALESVIRLTRDVELKEHAAELAQEEAAKGGVDVLDKVEELKKILNHAKNANDMHAGEVYGEKSILATELRELQSRVLYLADERDKSLAVLDEMYQTSKMRLAAAEDEISNAEQEKLRKEVSAREALSRQESLMERVVQEANILKQHAEENAKLREFLVDRGCVVDTLQGEIAVISQDVKLLKEKIDGRILLANSCSFPQTSCIIASSTSPLKGLIPDQVESVPIQGDPIESQQLMDPDKRTSVDEMARYDREALVAEGWDFLTNLTTEADF